MSAATLALDLGPVAALTPGQCRRLLKIGRPFVWQPPAASADTLRDCVRLRLARGEITLADLAAATAPRPPRTAVAVRCTGATVRDAGQFRVPTISVSLNGTVSVRLERTSRTEYTTVEAIYAMAVKQRVGAERADKARARKARR